MKVALLDANDVFLGQSEIAPADFNPAEHVDASEYGGDCDNAPGEYRWNRDAKRFEPLNNAGQELADDIARIVEFAARHSAADPAIDALIRKHFPAGYHAVQRAGK